MSETHRELQQFVRMASTVSDEAMLAFFEEATALILDAPPLQRGPWRAGDGGAPGVDARDLPVARNAPGEARCCALGGYTLWALSPDGTLELVLEGLPPPHRLRLLRDEDTLLLSAVAPPPRVDDLARRFRERWKRSSPTGAGS